MKSKALLGLLADGRIHSGETLASSLGVSRTAVWKQIKRATDEGHSIRTIRSKGYQLVSQLDLLDAGVILEQLPDEIGSGLSIAIHDELDSTNAEIIRQRPHRGASETLVCLADCQTEGRGRRGRQWQSPRGENLYLSLGLTFRGGFAILDGLSLVLGIAVAEALEKLGVGAVGLKWPNDVFVGNSKLAGILVELQGELEEGVVNVVAGIGINVHMTETERVEQAWTSLARTMPHCIWQRNRIAAIVIESVLEASARFAEVGFQGFREHWQMRDIFRDKPLATGTGGLSGVGRGVDDQGNYLIEVGSEVKRIRAGEISLRANL